MATYNLSDLRQIATIYSESATYNKGEYCVYQGLFYRCTTAIATAESWTAEHWTQVTVADELAKKVETASTITDTATGAIASFPDGAAEPVIDLTCQIDPVQDLSGTISGHEGMTIKRMGKNLIPYPYYDASGKTNNGITYTVNSDGSVTAVGTATSTSQFILSNTLSLPDGDYVLTGDMDTDTGSGHRTSILFNENSSSGASHWNEGIDVPCLFTVNGYTLANVRIRINSGVTVNQTFYPMLERGTVAHDYAKYQGDTYNISWQTEAGTVYGGTLDVTTGQLTIDMRLVEYAGASEEGWRSYSNWPNIYYVTLPARGVNGGEGASNYLKRSAGTTLGGMNDWEFICATYLNVKVGEIATLADWLAYLAEHPLQVCYEIIEPTVIQLPPVAVELLKGYNNVWSDTGDTAVEYYADLKAYIDKKIAEIGG